VVAGARAAFEMGDVAPDVSVVLAVYNGEEFVLQAVQSVLKQTLTDLELIIVDDASKDATPRILASVSDARVRVIRNERNLGIAASRNKGVRLARGEFIAVHDHDDVSNPLRLEKQVAFLRANPHCVAVGCQMTPLCSSGACRTRWPVTDLAIRWLMLFRTPLPHPGLVVRASALRQIGGYDEAYVCTVDYDLEARLARVGKLHNLPEALVQYRLHPGQVSRARKGEQERTRQRISERELGLLLGQGPVCARERRYAEAVFGGWFPPANEVRAAIRFSLRLADAFRRQHNCAWFISDVLSSIVARHLRASSACLTRGRWKEALVRCWGAVQLAASGLVSRPLAGLFRPPAADAGEDGDAK